MELCEICSIPILNGNLFADCNGHCEVEGGFDELTDEEKEVNRDEHACNLGQDDRDGFYAGGFRWA